MARKRSNIGKIMDLLEINIPLFSEYLHIDKTTISKWRTGARKLSVESPYFQAIISFFMEQMNKDNEQKIRYFFKEIYPKETLDMTEEICNCLIRFVTSEDSIHNGQLNNEKKLDSSFELYIGVEGRKEALNRLLDIAEHMESPSVIKILELEQMNWLCRDLAYLKNMALRLSNLARKQFKIEFAFSTEQNTPTFESLIALMEGFRFDKNISMYIVDTSHIRGLIPRIYAIDSKIVAIGLDSIDPSIPIHTNLFIDELNAYKYCRLFDEGIRRCGVKVLTTSSGKEIDQTLILINHMSHRKEDIFFYGDFLSIATMSEKLLIEILNNNDVFGDDRKRCLSFYKNLRKSVEYAATGYSSTYYFNLAALEHAISYDYLVEFELNAMTNKQIRKTASQYKQHLEDTIEYLHKHKQIRIGLLAGGHFGIIPCTWVKNNLWSLSINTSCAFGEHQICFLEDKNLINMSSKICEETVKAFPFQHKSRDYNLNLLQAIVDNIEI